MPAISFSGTTSRGPFWKQILEGRKTQTCRKPRKRPLKEGQIVKLYWKQRVPPSLKPIHLIGTAVITKIERKKYRDFAWDFDFAVRDGFADPLELQKWFGDPDENSEAEYDVIHFELIDRGLTQPLIGGGSG